MIFYNVYQVFVLLGFLKLYFPRLWISYRFPNLIARLIMNPLLCLFLYFFCFSKGAHLLQFFLLIAG